MMKTTLLLCSCFLLLSTASVPAQAQTVAQTCENFTPSFSITSITCTFGSNITAHHGLEVCMTMTGLVTITLSGDTGAWIEDVNGVGFHSNQAYMTCFYNLSATGGGSVLTATFIGGSVGYPAIIAIEIGGGTSFGVDASDGGLAGGSSTTVTSNSISLTHPGDLGICFIAVYNSNTITPESGWTSSATNSGPTLAETKTSLTSPIQATAGLASSAYFVSHITAWYAGIKRGQGLVF
jgi:hypothetical protein